MSDITSRFVENIVKIRYEDIPDEVLIEKKKNILDVLGVMLAGTAAEGCGNVVDLIKYWGGCQESSVVGYGVKTSLYNATIANCMMARALDFDDVFREGTSHVNATPIPAGLSVSEKIGDISGKDFLTAITLAVDLQCRLALASSVLVGVSGMSFTYQFGTFGAAAVAGKLMRLNEEQMRHAMGIAYSQMAGNNQGIIDGALTVRLQQGLSAGNGILSAILAQRGITGAKDPIAGKFGYYDTYQQGKYDADPLLSGLGKRFEGVYHGMKPYPSCMQTHGVIDGVSKIQAQEKVDFKDIQRIEIGINQAAYNLTCNPLEKKRIPETVVAAQFSMPYVVASSLVKGGVFIEDFTEEAIKRPEVLGLAKKVYPRVDENINSVGGGGGLTQTDLKITLKGGVAHHVYVEHSKGSPENPMTLADCIEKFLKCSRIGVKPLTAEKGKRVVDMVLSIEKLKTLNELISLIV